MENYSNSIINKVLNLKNDLYRFAYSLTLNEEDARDLLQDTYVKVLQASDKYCDNSNLKAWVFTIMKNNFINHYRRKKLSNVIIDTTGDLRYLNNTVTNPCDAADMHLYANEINKCLSDKKQKQRLPFEMFLDGYKYNEIADILKISIGTVKSRIFFMRQKLMEELQDDFMATYLKTA